MKIIVSTIILVISFAGYVLLFGTVMGIKPAQMTAVFGSQSLAEAGAAHHGESLGANADSLNDSLHTELADSASLAAVFPQIDTIQEQMASITRQKAELEKLKSEVSTILKAKAKADSTQISNLAKMYDGVEPAQLAQVMANMDDSLVIAILPRLKSQKAGKILEQMP